MNTSYNLNRTKYIQSDAREKLKTRKLKNQKLENAKTQKLKNAKNQKLENRKTRKREKPKSAKTEKPRTETQQLRYIIWIYSAKGHGIESPATSACERPGFVATWIETGKT